MTDTKASYYQDYQDALNENAKLRAEVEAIKKRENDGVELFDGIVAELRAELASLRQQAEAAAPSDACRVACHDCGRGYGDEHGFPDLVVPNDVWQRIAPKQDGSGMLCPSCLCRRAEIAGVQSRAEFRSGPFCVMGDGPVQQAEATAAPSDAEIEEWRPAMQQAIESWDCAVTAAESARAWRERVLPRIDQAVAMMRRATAAPAQSALREAAQGVVDGFDCDDLTPAGRKAMDKLIAALAAAPDAKEPSGVVVPEEVRAWVSNVAKNGGTGMVLKVAEFILSLPTPQPVAALDAEEREELEALRDEAKQCVQAVERWKPLRDSLPEAVNDLVNDVRSLNAQNAALDDTRRSERAEADELQAAFDKARTQPHWKESWATPLLEVLARKAGAK